MNKFKVIVIVEMGSDFAGFSGVAALFRRFRYSDQVYFYPAAKNIFFFNLLKKKGPAEEGLFVGDLSHIRTKVSNPSSMTLS